MYRANSRKIQLLSSFFNSWQLLRWWRNPLLLWNLKVHHCFHKNQLLDSILSCSVYSTPLNPTSVRFTLVLSSHLYLGLPSCLFLWGFPAKILYIFLQSMMCATHPVHNKLLYITFKTIMGEEHKLWCSLCNFLHSLITSSDIHPNIVFSKLLSNALNLCSSCKNKGLIYTHIKEYIKL